MLNSALSLASWIAARILCLASVFTPCPALSPASWFAARYLCLAFFFLCFSSLTLLMAAADCCVAAESFRVKRTGVHE